MPMTSKVWEVMNDLEMMTSKICSAREIIDTAAEAIQKHDYDKAETLAMAAYEFLGYYLDEFDAKFKLAWQETVVKQKKEEEDAWDAVIRERNYYEGKPDADLVKEYALRESEYCTNVKKSDAIEENKKTSWTLPVGDDFSITFPDDLLERLAWKEGDILEWTDQGDGSFKLEKTSTKPSWVEGNELGKTKTYDEMVADGWEMTDDGFWIKSDAPSSIIEKVVASDEC